MGFHFVWNTARWLAMAQTEYTQRGTSRRNLKSFLPRILASQLPVLTFARMGRWLCMRLATTGVRDPKDSKKKTTTRAQHALSWEFFSSSLCIIVSNFTLKIEFCQCLSIVNLKLSIRVCEAYLSCLGCKKFLYWSRNSFKDLLFPDRDVEILAR